jgi:hypothetical protein
MARHLFNDLALGQSSPLPDVTECVTESLQGNLIRQRIKKTSARILRDRWNGQ